MISVMYLNLLSESSQFSLHWTFTARVSLQEGGGGRGEGGGGGGGGGGFLHLYIIDSTRVYLRVFYACIMYMYVYITLCINTCT